MSDDNKEGEGRLNRITWLKRHGLADPFLSKSVQAEDDDILKQCREEAFVPVPYYESIKGTPDDPGYRLIFAETGGGKTTVMEAIKRYYDDLLGKENEPQVLVAVYNSFEDLPTGKSVEENFQQAFFRAHIEKIIELILSRLFEILDDERQSALLKRMKSNKIKKQFRWYLLKFLSPFPWQFERLQRKVRLRSYLPLFHYVIRVLLGALGSLVPATGPLAEALGKFPNYANSEKPVSKFPVVGLLSELVRLCKEIGFDCVYLMIDNVDNDFSPTDEGLEKGFQRIEPMLLNYQFYTSIEGLIIKAFLPKDMQKFYDATAHRDKILGVPMTWTKELIRDVYERRLRICQKLDIRTPREYDSEGNKPSLAVLCEPSLKEDIDNLMVKFSTEKKTPRALIQLGFHLLDEHFSTGDRYVDELIPRETYERALSKMGPEEALA